MLSLVAGFRKEGRLLLKRMGKMKKLPEGEDGEPEDESASPESSVR